MTETDLIHQGWSRWHYDERLHMSRTVYVDRPQPTMIAMSTHCNPAVWSETDIVKLDETCRKLGITELKA